MIICTACCYDKNPDDAEYCDACGSELQAVVTPAPTVIQPQISSPQIPQPSSSTTIAKLISKQPGSPVPELILDSNAIVGIFDPDMC